MLGENLLSLMRQIYLRGRASIWLFPVILTLPLVLLTSLGVSGTSVGAYYPAMHGAGAKDPNLIAGHPRGVRSDEWVVSSQMVIAQVNNGFKQVNDNIANGQDMSLMDVPYKEWSVLFKPQNLAFFVLPAENAFAFRWWVIGFILVMASYFFILELFPKNPLRAALLSSLVGLTPMMFWWYAGGALLTVAYCFVIALLALKLFNARSALARLSISLLLAYTFGCFMLLLYPPFQIPCMVVTGAFLISWLLYSYPVKILLKKLGLLWPYILIALALATMVGFMFYQGRQDVIRTVTSTVYPGKRDVKSGPSVNVANDRLLIFSSFLAPVLQEDKKAGSGYFTNQSEASNFIFIAPFLILPSLFLIYAERKQTRKLNWALITTNGLLLLLLGRMLVATPLLDHTLHKLLLLNSVPHGRLLIGTGLLGIFQLTMVVHALERLKLKKSVLQKLALIGSLTALGTMVTVGSYTIGHFPVFIKSYPYMLFLALWVSAGVFFVLKKQTNLGLGILVLFSLFSVYRVHPLYKGWGPLVNSEPIKALKSYPSDGSWVVVDDLMSENLPVVAGKPAISSVHFYPQLKMWRELDPEGKFSEVYNRYAHIVFTSSETLEEPFKLVQSDFFFVKFEPCETFLQKKAKYVLSANRLTDQCLVLREHIPMQAKQYYIYEITPMPSS